MGTALPFDGFLAVLRARGYAVGVDRHLDLGALLRRWERTTNAEFADALAALLGRSEEEVLGIRRLFHETYAPRPPVVSPPPPAPVPPGRWRGIVWAAAAILALLLFQWIRPTPRATTPSPAPSPSIQPTAARTMGPLAPVAAPTPNPPALPAAPRRIVRRAALGVFGGAFLLALAALWANRTRLARRASVRDSWSAALGALPGPYQFPLRLPTPVSGLRRIDVEDAATILGRAISVDGIARELDVRRSLRSTVMRGLMPTLVFKPRRRIEAVLVVQDVSQGMSIWHAKVEAFLANLRRQGIPLERWYFDGDIRRVSEKPHHAPRTFDTAMRRRPGAQVLIVSDGIGLTSTLATGGNDAWLRTLRGHAKRSWLTPVSDSRLWPAEFETIPVNVWPMTRRGLVQAARDLAGIDARALDHERARIVAEERVSLDDIERMKRVASLVPHPAIDLLELLRRRFTPDVSDAVIPHLLAEAGVHTAPVLRLSDDEVQRCVAMVRHETPRLEGEVRAALVEILKGSEPIPGSAAHLRWKLALSVQQMALGAAHGVDAPEAQASLAELGRGPLWEEVGRLVRLEQGAPAYGRVGSALGAGLAERVTQPESGPAGLAIRIPWARPGAREALPALLLSGVAVLAASLLGRLPARDIPHVADAYDLRHVAGDGSAGVLEARFSDGRNDVSPPSRVDLYQGDALFRSTTGLRRATSVSLPLGSEDTGKHYQVRGTLPRGNLALSPWVWVPSDSQIIVLIDAQPWARVTISPATSSQGVAGASESIGPQVTPFSAALAPGTYVLRLENGGVTPPLEQQLTVNRSSPRSLRFTMPGFDPNRKAEELLAPQLR